MKVIFSVFISVFFILSATSCKKYTNPVNPEITIGDPFILLHDGIFYMYGTNASGKGFKCSSSEDLITWKGEGFVYQKTDASWGKGNFWAPEVYFYRDEFYLAFSCKGKTPDNNPMLLCLARSSSPTGPFEDLYVPWFDPGYSCIDAHIFFDEEEIYLFYDKVGYEGQWPDGYLFGEIWCRKLNEDLHPVSEPVFCCTASQGWENPESMNSRCNEGAYVLKRNDQYYLTYSANHYKDPFYGIGYAVADSPEGPWVKNPDNPILGMDAENGIFGPGHNAFFLSPDAKELFIVYHTHISEENKERKANIDRIKFNKEGKLEILGPTREPQKLPSGL